MIKKDYRPRVFAVLAIFFILYVIILVRLFLIQIYNKNFFKTIAQQQYEVDLTIHPDRAKIFDRNNNLLVINKQTYSAFLIPNQITEKDRLFKFLKKNHKNVYQSIIKNPSKKFIWLERHLSKQSYEQLKNLNLNDINFIDESERFYPYKDMSTVLGFTDIDNFGIAGLELEFNKLIGGLPTNIRLERDARSGRYYIEKEIIQEGQKGTNLKLTLDQKIQFLAYDELKRTVINSKAKSGSVLIMNPESGEILTMANYPDFDPNQKELISLEFTKNRVVTECFEVGSVVKAFAALAALEEKVVTPDEIIDCEGKIAYIQNFKVENWKAVDKIPFTDVIKNSSNVGIAKVALRLGSKYYDHLKRLGFGQKTGIEFIGERAGYVNPPNKWSRSSNIVMSFGYEIMATIMQIGKAFCIISNGGYDINPTLLIEPKLNKKNKDRKKLYSDLTISQMKDILSTIGALHNKGLDGYRVMGKTGTARCVKDGHYSKKDHDYTFAGIIEKDNYKRVIITFIQEPEGAGLWASQITAPLFNKIAEKMVIYERDAVI